MDAFLRLSLDERRSACESAQTTLGLPPASLEKDFWVCWTLRELFRLPEWSKHLTFKGGTSLSKGWRLIQRFSEDVDVVLDRDFLGFPGERLSNKHIKKLRNACSRRITQDLLPALRTQITDRLAETGPAEIEAAGPEDDPDLQTLLFRYPTAFTAPSGYVKPVVRIELGARSDAEPSEVVGVTPLLAEALPAMGGIAAFPVRTVSARRTSWEKAMLLHEETYRPSGSRRKPRLSRHYYDLWCLITKGIAAEAIQDQGLFERVAAHRETFFRLSWMDYSTLCRGRLRLVPLPDQIAEWRRDYSAMRGEMFYGQPPQLDDILSTVRTFEAEFNGT